jgi:protein O-GlcNAc transferase
VRQAGASHANDATPERRLRIGYVSAEFRAHPVSQFFEPILACHDREQFETFCYSDVGRPDHVSGRMRSLATVWRETRKLSDEQLAQHIRTDGIDVLVDLSGHMTDHRLLAFARRPAPVQVTYLGYPDTTGLATMDYRITDSHHDPPGLTERYHTEHLIRLDSCCWCYRPDDDAPDVRESPVVASGIVTFGVLNKLVKINSGIIQLWCRILEQTPGSKLMVLVGPRGSSDQTLYERFRANGIGTDRLLLVERTGRPQYLARHHTIDVALDTFPYNGHTTTCDALWMGVPVVTLAGRTHVSRTGVSVLSNVGLRELVAESPEAYVAKAVSLTQDLPRLAWLRRGLRERIRLSPLCEQRGFASRLEAAYRNLWHRWCMSMN